MLLITEGKRKENQLGYNKKTQEYVYIHHGKEVWREKGDDSLLNYFNGVRVGLDFEEVDIMEMPTYEIWNRYCESCMEFDKKENAWAYR